MSILKKVNALPQSPEPNVVYFVKSGNTVQCYVTAIDGTPYPLETIDNSTDLILLQADNNLSGHRVVSIQDNGLIDYSDYTDQTSVNRIIGITTQSVLSGDFVIVQGFGLLDESSFSFSLGAKIFLGVNGTLVETPPSPGYQVEVARAMLATQIFIDFKDVILTI